MNNNNYKTLLDEYNFLSNSLNNIFTWRFSFLLIVICFVKVFLMRRNLRLSRVYLRSTDYSRSSRIKFVETTRARMHD